MKDYYNDGDFINISSFLNKGYDLDLRRDVSRKMHVENNKVKYDYKLCFVGILINQNKDIIPVFPKGFKPKNIKNDINILLKTISLHIQRNPSIYFGREGIKKYTSNYPFYNFFEIYKYYINYGLYQDNIKKISKKPKNKINWKKTISKSEKYIIRNSLYFNPYIYEYRDSSYNFITECMIFIIEETLENFNFFLNLNSTGIKKVDMKKYSNNYIINKLYSIRSTLFRNEDINLLDNIISYFNNYNLGGSFYLKHYNFASIWEDMVLKYLNRNFYGVNNNRLILVEGINKYKFKKKKFYPNLQNNNQSIQPDYYCFEGDEQYIFDAKYYDVISIDYKQICYHAFLMNKYKNVSTYSILITPAANRSSEIHFEMNPEYNIFLRDLKILIEKFDIYNVMHSYNK